MDDRIDTYEASEIWLHGINDEHPDRQCPNCSEPIDRDRLVHPEDNGGMLLCPECHAELPWDSLEDIPFSDWFNWACLEKLDYEKRKCFDEPKQRALRLSVSVADPRGGDIGLEITKTTGREFLVKVVNHEGMTYAPYVGTSIEGSYTVVRFELV